MNRKTGLFLCLALALGGCGTKTYEVTGSVKLDGEPVPEGYIAFVPEDQGSGGGGPIINGEYKIQVPAGKVKVEITASKMQPLQSGRKGMYGKTEELRQYIPAKYNNSTELSADVSAPIRLDFDLKSSDKPK